MAEESVKTVCRICSGACGLVLTLDQGQVRAVRGDRTHPVSRGYACNKGLEAPVVMQGRTRLRHALRRRPDGGFDEIPAQVGLDEIAERLRRVIDAHGGPAVGFFRGTGAHLNPAATLMREALMSALGTANYYSTSTIDQSCHMVTAGRMGTWNAGKQRLEGADVALIIGANPLVSLGAYGLLSYDPQKRLKAARAQGLRLIVIDPRRTETAGQADLFLQPRPGEDPTVLAGLINLILANGWHDQAFCERWVAGLAELATTVKAFDADYVARRADVPAEQLLQAAALFARDARRGPAILGTGVSMAPRSNLSSHLVESLNAICGRMLRAGDRVPNPGLLSPVREFRAEAAGPARPWEGAPKMITGHGALAGERMTGALADQILLDGPEQVRALFVNGANLAVSAPNQRRFVEALRSLELLVTCEHFLTPTAELSDYVIPATTAFERPDLLFPPPYEQLCDIPFSQYIPPALPPPDEALDEWRVFWGLGRRLGVNLAIRGRPVDMTTPPQTDQLLALAIEGGRVSLDELRAAPDGVLLQEEVRVLPARPSCTGRLHVAPQDVIDELAQVGCEGFAAEPGFRLTARRLRGVMNSLGIGWETARREREDNPAYLHPDDMASLDLVAGDRIEIASEFGAIEATVAPDGGLRPGVVAMAHAWGGLPDGEGAAGGSNTNLLVGTDRCVEPINAMPAMSAIPVKIAKAGRQVATVPAGPDRRATT